MKNPLVLGTAQMGMPYGIANRIGQPDIRTAVEIIRCAWEGGIRELDTASAYGESEKVIGRSIREIGIADEIKIVTKIDLECGGDIYARAKKKLLESLHNLGVAKIYALLLHRQEMLQEWSGKLKGDLLHLVDEGLVEHIGISVYTPQKALQALQMDGLNLVQVPSNVLDRRFERAGVFQTAQECGKTVYVRSIFLQGLLVMDPETLPPAMDFVKPYLEQYGNFASCNGFSRQQFALQYALSAYPGARILFGAESPWQVCENLACADELLPSAALSRIREIFAEVPEKVLNPVHWPVSRH